MNVVHLITSIDKGGAENHLASLARGLKNKNIKIYVIYLKKEMVLENIIQNWALR